MDIEQEPMIKLPPINPILVEQKIRWPEVVLGFFVSLIVGAMMVYVIRLAWSTNEKYLDCRQKLMEYQIYE